jgi:opacity protein-like surface antigen
MKLVKHAIAAGLLLVAAPALAQRSAPSDSSVRPQASFGWQGWGVRAGVASDADQVLGGAQFNFGEVATRLRFQPDVLLGAGDDATSLFGTAPLYYRFRQGSGMTPYAGGGVALGWVDHDAPGGGNSDSEFEVGARATGGLEWPRGRGQAFFVELSLGFGDVQDVTAVAAWAF